MRLACRQLQNFYDFARVALQFVEGQQTNVFSLKNNKTLKQTLDHKRYTKLKAEVLDRYSRVLDEPLGHFLLDLKFEGDQFYRKFLNSYGDSTFSTFRISDALFQKMKGVYAYVVDNEVMYIGRCKDSMSKRINHGYGKIHPKNCYLDGQATNCHLNARITKVGNTTELWFRSFERLDEIAAVEQELIRAHNPPWNIHRYV